MVGSTQNLPLVIASGREGLLLYKIRESFPDTSQCSAPFHWGAQKWVGIQRGFYDKLSQGKDEKAPVRNVVVNSILGHFFQQFMIFLTSLNICFQSYPFPKYQLVISVSTRKSYMALLNLVWLQEFENYGD